jgi:hypothetical protein
MEAIMEWLIRFCARGALGLGAAALLLTGVPAHASSAAGAPAGASRESQPLRLAQSTAQQEEAEKQKQELQKKEQQKKEYDGGVHQQKEQPKKAKTRGPMPEATPSKPGASRSGAGVVRESDPGEAEVP